MLRSKTSKAISILLIFHLVGLAGILSPYRSLFLLLTPVHLLVCLVTLFWSHRDKKKSLYVASGVIFSLGFILEWVGVKTGFPFGYYHYGRGLGPGLDGIPLMIGVNWLLLIYALSSVLNPLPLPVFLKALIGAMVMVLIDFFIEPLSSILDYWHWEGGSIPKENYWGWFGYSFLLLIIFDFFDFRKFNPVAKYYIGFQTLFFIILNVALR